MKERVLISSACALSHVLAYHSEHTVPSSLFCKFYFIRGVTARTGDEGRIEAGLAICLARKSDGQHTYRPADLRAGQPNRPLSDSLVQTSIEPAWPV